MKNKSFRLLDIQEISKRTGFSLSLLNYYTNLGLLPVADRQGNKRLFMERIVIGRLGQIRRLRREGYPLRIIRHRFKEERL